jgi:hypothetical protein
MIQVDLSDFTGDELARLRKERQDAHEAELTKFNDRKREHQAQADNRQREYEDAWASRRLFKAVMLWCRFILEPSPPVPPAPAISAITERERILEAGAAGQRFVIERLAARLDDRWIALCGYLNFKGEVDIVLIGPGGIACIEVKTLNAEVTVDGDEWRRQFRGRNGHAMGAQTLVVDQGGRSPARQVNEPAEHLRQWLQRHGIDLTIRRWVVLAHANSRIAAARNLTVDAVVRADELDVERLLGMPHAVPLAPEAVGRARQLVERDHQFHTQRRAAASNAVTKRAAVAAREAGEGPAVAGRDRDTHEGKKIAAALEVDQGSEAATSLHRRRVAQLAVRARRLGETRGQDEVEAEKLRKAIAHDLLVRSEPTETPDLLEELKYEPAAEIVLQILDESRQVFELDDRCLLAFAIPVGIRLRRFGNHPVERSAATEGSLDFLSHRLRGHLNVQQMVFDNRLYSLTDLATVGPRDWLRYLSDLEANANDALPVVQPMTVKGRPDASWEMTCLLGVASCDPTVGQKARGWTRIHLNRIHHEETEKALMSLKPHQWVPGMMEELSSCGLWMLPHGLRAGADAATRLATGTQVGSPKATFTIASHLGRRTGG